MVVRRPNPVSGSAASAKILLSFGGSAPGTYASLDRMAQESILRKLRNSPGLYLDDDFCAVFLATFKEGKNDYLDGRSVEVASIDESTMWIQELR